MIEIKPTSTGMDETRTLQALRVGNIAAFEKMLFAYEKRIFNYLLRFTSNPPDAEDLTQEVFLKVYKNRETIDPEDNFKSWLYTIATNTAYDWLRRKRGKETLALPEEDELETISPSATYKLNEDMLDVAAALEKIRPDYRNVLLLFYMQGLSYEEIAAALKLPINTVKTHLRRAKESLRRTL